MNNNISIQAARKIIGKGNENMSDTQVQDLIFTLTLLARQYLRYNSSNITLGENDGK